jgi:histidine triad (HIT) family protein
VSAGMVFRSDHGAVENSMILEANSCQDFNTDDPLHVDDAFGWGLDLGGRAYLIGRDPGPGALPSFTSRNAAPPIANVLSMVRSLRPVPTRTARHPDANERPVRPGTRTRDHRGGCEEEDMIQPDCTFCGIVAGRVEHSLVCADAQTVAVMDLQPVNAGHVLVLPRRHAAGLMDLPVSTGEAMWRTAHRIGRALRRSGLRCEGINLFLADGEAAFQEVFHAHLHVFPRFAGDRFRVDADWHQRERAELDAAAADVRSALATVDSA